MPRGVMFNFFDIFVLVIVGSCVYFGYQTGIIASIFYILSGFVGMWAANKFAPNPGVNFYLVFFAGAGTVVLIGFIIGKIFKKALLGMFDRVAGVVLGIILGLAITGTVVFPIAYHFPESIHNKVINSFSGKKFMPWLRKMYPDIKQFNFDDLKNKIHLPKLPDFKKTVKSE
jgi:membrane protein required for colicin V production